MITRYSSRQASLGSFLPNLLVGARRYDRIAGYFRSSILEVAGEALDTMADGACVRIVCNSDLNPLDVQAASAAKQAMYREWRSSLPEDIPPALQRRLERLYSFLASGRLKVRVLPDDYFGLIHGKAGVITRADGAKVAFMGSANESLRAWKVNYEIVWSDDSAEGVAWAEKEFEALWGHKGAVDLAEAVVQDVERVSKRVVIPTVGAWKEETDANPAAAAIELPIYSRENGLWAHQKYFIRLAFDLHKRGGARLVLADQVGLGKTVQLALTAKLIALWEGGGRVVAFVPKTLMRQWQEELWSLLRLPSAIWTGRGWEDERGVLHPEPGIDGLQRCPRKLGIVSTGLLTQSGDALEVLASLTYACVILDEAHRARRRNLGSTHRHEKAEPNNLLQALRTLSTRTTSLLLATATPVQIDPIEAWDLLNALGQGNLKVLGSSYSRWTTQPRQGLAYVLQQEDPPQEPTTAWEWMRDPLPPREEGREFAVLRNSLRLPDNKVWAQSDAIEKMRPPDRKLVQTLARDFFQEHNPFIRHIVRRTREFLETHVDPETNEPYLKPVRVRLFGEDDSDAVPLPAFLRDAYTAAEDFCKEVGKRPRLNSGFLKTILLRRIGSTLTAGQKTAIAMLGPSGDTSDDEEFDETPRSSLYPLTDAEREHLEHFLRLLEAASGQDPKYQVMEDILLRGVSGTAPWIEAGSIIFSQFYDSAFWAAQRLSTRLPEEPIGLYAGGTKSGIFRAGAFTRLNRESIKQSVFQGELRLMFGTDAASEGLNLQKVGTLINLDLPWNPTRLEQRKGRIQRIGQIRDEVLIYNMRYRESVEDRVHELLSARLKAVHALFGQLPDTLEDVWVAIALRDEQRALELIGEAEEAHPFEIRYDRIEPVDWETCSQVLDSQSQIDALLSGW
jgi:superfamily II DNA or RNA helicase